MNKKKLAIIISSAAVAVIAIVLAIVLPLTLIKKEKPSDSEPPQGATQPEPSLPGASQPAQTFIKQVTNINIPVTLDSGAEIEAGYIIYAFMTDADKDADEVKENKVLLDGYKAEYDVLKAAKDEEDRLAMQAALRNRFATAVSNLPDIDSLTSENRKDIDEVYALYEQLDEQSRQYTFVRSAYASLTEANNAVAEIERKEHLAEVAKKANEFIEAVELCDSKIAHGNISSLEDLYFDLDDLSREYKNFPDDVKQFKGVAEAKEKLDKAFEKYQALKDADDVDKFIAYAEELSPLNKVTLDSEKVLSNAEYLYREMSENAKSAKGVAEALEIVKAARVKYDRLFEEREQDRIFAFLVAEAAVSEKNKKEEMNISWYKELDAAKDAYWLLSRESQNLQDVQEAFKRWNAVQTAFDRKYDRLKLNEPNMWIAADGNLVLNNELGNQSVTKPLCEFYGVDTKNELDEKAILWLHVYVDGKYEGKTAIRFADISGGPGHIVLRAVVVDALKQLAKDNDKVVSGAKYAFSFSCEDRENKYIPSSESKVCAECNENLYTW